MEEFSVTALRRTKTYKLHLASRLSLKKEIMCVSVYDRHTNRRTQCTVFNEVSAVLKEHTHNSHWGRAFWKHQILQSKLGSGSRKLLALRLTATCPHTRTHTHTFVPGSQNVHNTQPGRHHTVRGTFVLEDLRTLTPVLSIFGLPVTAPVDINAFSRWIIGPLLKPLWLVTFNVLP